MLFKNFLAHLPFSFCSSCGGGSRYRGCFLNERSGGYCLNCTSKYLSEVANGKTVAISGFIGCRASECRLRSMGLSVGDDITVLNNSGPFIIANGDNRIVIGKGLAKKIVIVQQHPIYTRSGCLS